jgi:S1-C subfamily serine protease
VPEPPNFDVAAILGAMWVLECDAACIQGTAFALSDVGLVTCAHVLGADTHAFRFDKPEGKFKTKVLRSHDVIDLAVLEIDTELHYLRAGDPNALKQMDHLLVAGHPNYRLGDWPFVSPGLLIGWRTRSAIRRLMTNAPIVRGASGGPVLDRQGLVVGVAVTGAERFSQAGETEDHGIVPIDALGLLTR